MGTLSNIVTITTNVKDILKYLKDINVEADKLVPKLSKAANSTKGVKANGKIGQSAPRAMGTDNVSFSSESMNNILDQHLGAIREASNNYQRASATMGAISSGVSALGGIAKASFGMMPDVGAVVDRATSYYGAGVTSGYGNRQRIASATFSGLNGGMTAPGNDAAIAQYLTATGVNFSSNPQSQYMRTVGAVGNLAKYMNMDNMAATQAVTGFYSGKGSRQLMQTLGIFTSDPTTGAPRKLGAIMTDIGSRLRNGRKLTAQGVQDSFFRGNLGVDLKGIGFSDDQQQIMKQYLIEKANGNNLDLNDNKTMEKLAKKAGVNPQAALQAINTSNTGAMQNAESSYLAGIKAAAPLIQSMNEQMKGFVQTMGGVNSALATLQGSNSTSGLLGAVSSAVGGVAQVGGNLAMMKMAGGKLGGVGNLLGGIGGKAGSFLKGAGGKALGVAGAALVGGMDVVGGIQSHNNGQIGKGVGETAGMIGGAIAGQALIPIPILGGLIGGAVGGWAGGMIGQGVGNMFGNSAAGGNSAGNDSANTAPPSATGIWLIYPVKSGYKLGAGWQAGKGSKNSYWGDNGHGGLDFQGVNMEVIASAAGTVKLVTSSNALGTYLTIDHKNGYVTVYCHLSSAAVKQGDTVAQGQKVGISGNSGFLKDGTQVGHHLHFALCQGGDGKNANNSVDPTPYLRGGFPTKWSMENQVGTSVDKNDMQNDATPLASNTSNAPPPPAPAPATASALVPAGYSPAVATASSLVKVSQSGISAGDSGIKLDNSSANTAKSMPMLMALKKAGFSGDALTTAAAIANATSHGNAGMHARVGNKDTYGLFQIDFGGPNASELKQHYALKDANQALDPLTNAKIAFDMSKQGTDWSAFPEYKNEDYKKFITGAPKAKNGRSYVANDGPINVHAGEAILTSEQADVWRDAIKTSYASKTSGSNITINVNVAQASEAEARRLATMVKDYLKEDKLTDNMRSF